MTLKSATGFTWIHRNHGHSLPGDMEIAGCGDKKRRGVISFPPTLLLAWHPALQTLPTFPKDCWDLGSAECSTVYRIRISGRTLWCKKLLMRAINPSRWCEGYVDVETARIFWDLLWNLVYGRWSRRHPASRWRCYYQLALSWCLDDFLAVLGPFFFFWTKLLEHIYQAINFLNFSLGSCDTFLLIHKEQRYLSVLQIKSLFECFPGSRPEYPVPHHSRR